MITCSSTGHKLNFRIKWLLNKNLKKFELLNHILRINHPTIQDFKKEKREKDFWGGGGV